MDYVVPVPVRIHVYPVDVHFSPDVYQLAPPEPVYLPPPPPPRVAKRRRYATFGDLLDTIRDMPFWPGYLTTMSLFFGTLIIVGGVGALLFFAIASLV